MTNFDHSQKIHEQKPPVNCKLVDADQQILESIWQDTDHLNIGCKNEVTNTIDNNECQDKHNKSISEPEVTFMDLSNFDIQFEESPSTNRLYQRQQNSHQLKPKSLESTLEKDSSSNEDLNNSPEEIKESPKIIYTDLSVHAKEFVPKHPSNILPKTNNNLDQTFNQQPIIQYNYSKKYLNLINNNKLKQIINKDSNQDLCKSSLPGLSQNNNFSMPQFIPTPNSMNNQQLIFPMGQPGSLISIPQNGIYPNPSMNNGYSLSTPVCTNINSFPSNYILPPINNELRILENQLKQHQRTANDLTARIPITNHFQTQFGSQQILANQFQMKHPAFPRSNTIPHQINNNNGYIMEKENKIMQRKRIANNLVFKPPISESSNLIPKTQNIPPMLTNNDNQINQYLKTQSLNLSLLNNNINSFPNQLSNTFQMTPNNGGSLNLPTINDSNNQMQSSEPQIVPNEMIMKPCDYSGVIPKAILSPSIIEDESNIQSKSLQPQNIIDGFQMKTHNTLVHSMINKSPESPKNRLQALDKRISNIVDKFFDKESTQNNGTIFKNSLKTNETQSRKLQSIPKPVETQHQIISNEEKYSNLITQQTKNTGAIPKKNLKFNLKPQNVMNQQYLNQLIPKHVESQFISTTKSSTPNDEKQSEEFGLPLAFEKDLKVSPNLNLAKGFKTESSLQETTNQSNCNLFSEDMLYQQQITLMKKLSQYPPGLSKD